MAPRNCIVFTVLAEDPRGPVSEEDRKGKSYQTKRFTVYSSEKQYVRINSYRNHPLLAIGTTCSIANPMYRFGKLTVNQSTNIMKGFVTHHVSEDVYANGRFKVRQPMTPFIDINQALNTQPETFVSIRGLVCMIGEIRRWYDDRDKCAMDVTVRQGDKEITVTLWNQCVNHRLTIGDTLEIHDSKLKSNEYNNRSIWVSLNDNIWIHKQNDTDWNEYEVVGYNDEDLSVPNTLQLNLERDGLCKTVTVSHDVLKASFAFSESNKEIFLLQLFGKLVKAIISDDNVTKIAPVGSSKNTVQTLGSRPPLVSDKASTSKRSLSNTSQNSAECSPSKKLASAQ